MNKEKIQRMLAIRPENPKAKPSYKYLENLTIEQASEIIQIKLKVYQLQERTDKAIQYLEKNALAPIFLDCKMYETSAYNDLLKILKGSDK